MSTLHVCPRCMYVNVHASVSLCAAYLHTTCALLVLVRGCARSPGFICLKCIPEHRTSKRSLHPSALRMSCQSLPHSVPRPTSPLLLISLSLQHRSLGASSVNPPICSGSTLHPLSILEHLLCPSPILQAGPAAMWVMQCSHAT